MGTGQAPLQSPVSTRATCAKGRVLIIDDSETVLDVARSILEGRGYEVLTSANPLVSAHAIRKFAPDLVLVDLDMPAISGEVVVHVLSAHNPGIPIVLHSEAPEATLIETARRCGAAGFLPKTADPDAFVARVAGWLARQRP